MKTLKTRIFPAILAVVLMFSCFGTAAFAAENSYTEQFGYYVDSASRTGFVPERMKNDLDKAMSFSDALEFQLQFIKTKCGVDVDAILASTRAAYSDGDAIAAAINEIMGRSVYKVGAGADWSAEPPIYGIFLGFTSILYKYLAPLPPLIYDQNNSYYAIRYNFQNGSPAVYHDDVIFSLLSEIIGLSQGVPRADYDYEGTLTRRQLAAFCYMLSTMSLPKEPGGKYPGGISGNPIADGFVASVLDSVITPGMSSRDKVKAIYDYMIYNFAHDDDAMPIIMLGDDSGAGNPLASTVEYAMPIIITKKGTCDVFANVFRLLALRLGFECNYVSGQYVNGNGSKTGHGWNQIKVDDEWYWVDVDVEGSVYRRDGLSQPLYFLFMKKDSEWTSNHQWERAQWPACDSTKHPVDLEEGSIITPLIQQILQAEINAVPTSSTVLVNGSAVAFDAYNIKDNNYFKLRDLAYILSGTEKQFDVVWDGMSNMIALASGMRYTPVGNEMAGKGTGNKAAKRTMSRILLDGWDVSFTGYNIEDNNYFKLRDIGAAFDFGVDWDGARNTVIIDTSRGYTPEGAADAEVPTLTPTPTPVPGAGSIIAGVTIGGSLRDAESVLGNAYRTVDGTLQYKFYGNYTRFAIVGNRDGSVEYVYANYDVPTSGAGYKLYKDDRGGGRIYAAAAGSASRESVAVTEAIIFETANAFRAFHGLSALIWSDTLGSVARAHSADMAARNYFDHFSPEGKSPSDRMTAAGYKWLNWGENITAGYISGMEAVDTWIHSNSGHREQILTKDLPEIGVGCDDNGTGSYRTYATQVFGYPAGYKTTPTPTPTPKPTTTPSPTPTPSSNMAIVPDIIGLQPDEAERLLKAAGFAVAETRYYRIEFDPNPGDPWHVPVKDVPVGAVFGLSLISSGVLQHKDGISLAYRGATFSLDINNGHFDPVDQKLIYSDNGSLLMRMTEQEAIQYLRSIGLNAEIEYKPDYSFARGEVVAVTLPPNCTMQIDGKRYIDKGTAIKLWIGS